jgi:hypothetical protein
MESDRSRPYVYIPSLWGTWSLSEVWYYGDDGETCIAGGTGMLQFRSFGEKFGDEYYSINCEIIVPLSTDTILITKTENGIYYAELDDEEDDDSDDDLYFFPDSGPQWHSTFSMYFGLSIHSIPVYGGILYINWEEE